MSNINDNQVMDRNRVCRGAIAITLIVFFIVIISSTACAEVLFEDNFDNYSDDPDQHGWIRSYTQVTVEEGLQCYGESGRCIKIEYIDEGTSKYLLSRHLRDYREYYIRFYFKRTGHEGAGGCKFFKIRAIESSSNYANLTLQMLYGSGDLYQINHGCGTSLTNDQGCGTRYYLTTTMNDNGTVLANSDTYTFPDNDWHYFETYVKLNSNNNSDGAYTVWIDGEKRIEVINVKMRHNDNPIHWSSLLLANYNRFDGIVDPYELYYDNVVISTDYIGSVASSEKSPNAPTNLRINK